MDNITDHMVIWQPILVHYNEPSGIFENQTHTIYAATSLQQATMGFQKSEDNQSNLRLGDQRLTLEAHVLGAKS